ncbi:unnamed protein product [Notodromas monacha]|uniref:RRM domain-containing protein n=1 Tax=Notodromas monacha TaxID=399045 RepID=A0A7R9BYG3_9CRUS|nr:unnamed protein product [Notodromas monacha]CAG0922576.1 unnamed protein product [Notodromas monacha]
MSGRNDCRIYVGNLPPDIREKDIEDLFYKFGRIVFVDLKNKRGPPFAFVEFEDSRDCEDAVHARDGYDYDGYKLRVEFPRGTARGPGGRRDGGGGGGGAGGGGRGRGPPTKRTPYRVLVTEARKQGYAFYSHEEFRILSDFCTLRYMSHLLKGKSSGFHSWESMIVKQVLRDFQNLTKVMTSQRLPSTGSWQDLKDHMREAGEVCYADVDRDGTGVVEFLREEDMKYAIRKLDDTKFKSHEGDTAYIRVKEDASGGSGSRRSRSPRDRGSPNYSPRSEDWILVSRAAV